MGWSETNSNNSNKDRHKDASSMAKNKRNNPSIQRPKQNQFRFWSYMGLLVGFLLSQCFFHLSLSQEALVYQSFGPMKKYNTVGWHWYWPLFDQVMVFSTQPYFTKGTLSVWIDSEIKMELPYQLEYRITDTSHVNNEFSDIKQVIDLVAKQALQQRTLAKPLGLQQWLNSGYGVDFFQPLLKSSRDEINEALAQDGLEVVHLEIWPPTVPDSIAKQLKQVKKLQLSAQQIQLSKREKIKQLMDKAREQANTMITQAKIDQEKLSADVDLDTQRFQDWLLLYHLSPKLIKQQLAQQALHQLLKNNVLVAVDPSTHAVVNVTNANLTADNADPAFSSLDNSNAGSIPKVLPNTSLRLSREEALTSQSKGEHR